MRNALKLVAIPIVFSLWPIGAHAEGAPRPAPIVVRLDDRQIKAAGIDTQSLEREAATSEIIVPGVVVLPPQNLRIVAVPAAGLIERLMVSPDEDVKEGDPIAQLRSSELVESQRAFLAASSDQALSEEKLRRDQQLHKEGIIAERRLIVTRAEATQARAVLDERSQLLALQGMSPEEIDALRRTRRMSASLVIRAPMSGAILQRNGSPGERVVASAPLVTIARLSPFWTNLQTPVAHAAALPLVERVVLPSLGLEGKLVRIGRTVDATTQSVTAVAEFDTAATTARPGQAIQAILKVAGGGGAQWRAPASAVAHFKGSDWVFVRAPEGFAATPVEVISHASDAVSLRGPLRTDDKVATRGVLSLITELSSAGR
jgi:membrane fusion protein, heavy metal efflux system